VRRGHGRATANEAGTGEREAMGSQRWPRMRRGAWTHRRAPAWGRKPAVSSEISRSREGRDWIPSEFFEDPGFKFKILKNFIETGNWIFRSETGISLSETGAFRSENDKRGPKR